MIPTVTKNSALDGVVIDTASLHSDFPGSTGANELTGGSYARKSIVLNAASGGQRLLNAGVTFDVPSSTVRWFGFWEGTTFKECAPNGGDTPKNFMATPSDDKIVCTGHGWSDDQKVVFYRGTPPGGIVEGRVYYVIDAAADTFKVSETVGGTAVSVTSSAGYQCCVAAITEEVYASADTHTLSAATFAMPN